MNPTKQRGRISPIGGTITAEGTPPEEGYGISKRDPVPRKRSVAANARQRDKHAAARAGLALKAYLRKVAMYRRAADFVGSVLNGAGVSK